MGIVQTVEVDAGVNVSAPDSVTVRVVGPVLAPILKALTPIASKNGTRPVLETIAVEANPELGTLSFTAADGYVLANVSYKVIFETANATQFFADRPPFLLHREDAMAVAAQIKGDGTVGSEFVFHDGGTVPGIGSQGLNIRTLPGKALSWRVIECVSDEGQYPNWEQLVPEDTDDAPESGYFGVNANLMGRLLKLVEQVSESQNVARFQFTGPTEPAKITASGLADLTAVIMPMQIITEKG